MKRRILGWDVGGANIKAALMGPGRRPQVLERPFSLWRAPERLSEVLGETADALGGALPSDLMAVTMTAELADCFATKREGVGLVLEAFFRAFPSNQLHVYGVDGHFHTPEAARRAPHQVASANWMASASLAARAIPNALLLDVGSTTTDIIPIVDGRVAVEGRSDRARLGTGELVYTGVLRTPVCAIVRSVPIDGRHCPVAAELFAVAADVHLWLGRIEEQDYSCETPDGRGRSRAEAGARIARMVCADRELLGDEDITTIARYVAESQVRQIVGGIRQVLRRHRGALPPPAVAVGQGRSLASAAAARAGLESGDAASAPGWSSRAGTAAAVASLLALSH